MDGRLRWRRRTSGPRFVWILLFLTGVLSLILFGVDRMMAPVLVAYAHKQSEILGVKALNQAIRSAMVGRVDYEDLIRLQRDSEGHVRFMQVNTVLMGQILTDAENLVLAELMELENHEVGIPLGAATGSELFAAYGPEIPAKLRTVGSSEVFFDQSFETAGVNQTRHTIYLQAEAKIRILLPLRREDVIVHTRLPVVETVIVGPVPEQYLNLEGLFPLGRSAS